MPLTSVSRPATSRRSLRRVVAVLLVLSFAALWWTLLRPSSLGGPLTLVTVTGESMEPGLHTGDLTLVYEQDEYAPGDVIAFRAEAVPGKPGGHVIHRIVSNDTTNGYVTRGDNNDWNDPWSPTLDQIAGKMLFSVAGAGTGVRWLAEPVHLAAILAALVSGLTMVGGRTSRAEDELVPFDEVVSS